MSEVLFRENYTTVKGGVDLASVFFDAFSPVGQAGSVQSSLPYLTLESVNGLWIRNCPSISSPCCMSSEYKV